MFYVYRLRYSSETALNTALLSRGVLVDNSEFGIQNGSNTLSVVRLGTLVDVPATYNEDGSEDVAATYISGYHCDIKVKEELTFSSTNSIIPNNPRHGIKWAEGAVNL